VGAGLTTAGGGDGAGELALEPEEAAMRIGEWGGERAGGNGSGSASRRRSRRVRGEDRRAAWWRSGWDLRRGRSMAVVVGAVRL